MSNLNSIIVWDRKGNVCKAQLMATTQPIPSVSKITLEGYETLSFRMPDPEFSRMPEHKKITIKWVEETHARLSKEIDDKKCRLFKEKIIPVDLIFRRADCEQTIADMSRGRYASFFANEIIQILQDPFTLISVDRIKTMQGDLKSLFRWVTYLPNAPKDHVIEKTIREACKQAITRTQNKAACKAVREALNPQKPVPDLLALKMNGSTVN